MRGSVPDDQGAPGSAHIPVGLPSAVDTTEPDLDLQAVQLFCLAGLTLSFYLLHLLPVAMIDTMMLLTSTG
jgi:hypothetical protein